MKKIVAFIVSAAISSAFAAKCNFDKSVREFEGWVEHSKIMKGAKVEVDPATPDDPKEATVIYRTSKPVKDGIYSGKVMVDSYLFYGCRLMEVHMDKVDPETGNVVANSIAFIRDNGKLHAICPDGKLMYLADPFRFAPNLDCECFDLNGMPKKNGKYGCMTKSEFLEKKSKLESMVNGKF